MRLIDADAFREDYALAERCEDCRRYGKKDCDYPYYSARDFCGWLDDAPTIGGWISVKDRLPEIGTSILYCAFGRSVGEGTYQGFDGNHHVWNMYAVSGTHWDDEVTHWMPLPEPPKEVTGDE